MLLISGGFHAPTGAEPPWKEKNLSPALDKFLNTPWSAPLLCLSDV